MRNIEIFVNGNFCRKDSNNAGTQGEASVTSLNLTFSDDWAGYAKRIVWRDAKGENPTAILLAGNEQPYTTLIPPEALTEAGWCSFTLEGFLAGSPQDYDPDHIAITATDYLKVAVNDDEYAPAEPTPSQALQLQAEIEELEREIATGGVQKVNGVSPDEYGNVALEPSDIGAYEKPTNGIPKTDLNSDVKTSLNKADGAVQPAELSEAIEVAEGTMDTKDAATLSSAKDYADTAAAAAEESAKSHADARVAANPSGTATTTLTKIKIGNVVYEMPQGEEGGKTVVTVSGTTPSMSAYDIYRAALSGVVEILVDGFRLPLKYAESSLVAFAGVIESDDGPALLEVVIDTDAEMTAKVLYEVPSGGIPQTDLSSAVRTSLGKADTAYQKPSGGIPLSDISTEAKNALKRNAITLEPFLSSQTQYTMSMSMSEIYAAYQAGKDVYIEYEDPYTREKVDCRLIRIDGFDSAVFVGCKIDSGTVTAIVFTAMNNLAEKSEIAIGEDAVQISTQTAKTAAMTQPVGYDSATGKFYTAPSGGGGVTKYTVTFSGAQAPYTASMSSSEIYTAVQGGNIVEAVHDGETLTLSKSTSSVALFVGHALTGSEFSGLAIAVSGSSAMATAIPIQQKNIADTGGYYTTDTVEGALAEIGAQLDGIETALDGINDVLEGAL